MDHHSRRYWWSGIVMTVVMMALVAFGVTDFRDAYFYVVLIAMIAAVTAMYLAFPGSGFFCIALANSLAVYTCLFSFFSSVNFGNLSVWAGITAYMLPIVAFNVGAWFRRKEIRQIVTHERLREVRHPSRPFRWLVPVFAVGLLTFVLPTLKLDRATLDIALVMAMGIIALVVLFGSRHIAIFLIDVGIMFEDFFRRMSALVLPAVGFLAFYSINIITFACIYRIMDRFSAVQHFQISGVARDFTFPEALYFSVITLSTVGYGEMVPISDDARVVVAFQIVLGVLLLLFGFYEIISYARERNKGGR